MKTISKLLATAFLAISLTTSCTSYKNVPYIQNSDSYDLSAATALFDAHIMPKDILTITVNCPEDAENARIFNLVTQTDNGALTGNRSMSSQVALQQYIVGNDGTIDFPILGKIEAGGKTKTELENYIADRIYGTHLKKRPVVVVNMANYKIAVLGEVARPGIYTASNGKINIFEALAQAGDMTIYGIRDKVKLVRENASGEKEIHELNMNDASVIASPFYQLQQNDVVIVTPNKTKAKNSGIGSETSLWFTSTSILISLASLLYNILKK